MASFPALGGRGGFRVGEWVAYPSLNQLVRGEVVARVRPKVMDVLVHLATRPGEVVSKDEILDAVWAKKFLGDTALSRAVFELREVLGDDPQHPAYIETIPKRGYRLVASVQPFEAVAPVAASGSPEPVARSRSRVVVAAGGVIMAVVAGVVAMTRLGPFRSAAAPVTPKRIVVLPFENLGAPDDAYFAAGVTDEITSRLVSVQEISVISRSSAEHYAASKLSQREIGRELGVDFVLGGAVRWDRGAAGPNRVRITPRLVRVADDTQVWANVYDRVLEDIFSVQSEIARGVIAEVGIALQGPARSAVDRRPTANLEAYQAFLRGRYHAANIYRSEQDLRLGLRMFERAVALDPGFAVAWAENARVRAILNHVGFDRTEGSRAEAKRALDRALSLDAASASIHFDAALYHYWFNRDYPRALAEFALARKAGGETAGLLSAEGYLLRRQGRWEEALKRFEAAGRLDPRGWTVLRELGTTSLYMRRYADAERQFEQAIALAPDEPALYGFLAETYWTWRADTNAAAPVLRAMPKSLEPWQVRWRFWQDVYTGDLQAAADLLRASSFDVVDSSENWESRGLLLARVYGLLGRTDDARREFEQVRAEMERLLGQRPDDASLHSTLGLCLAGLGRKDEAVREGRRAVELVALRNDLVAGPGMALALAEVYTLVGEPESACAQLEWTLARPAVISAARLRMDPTWAPLRSHPCFAVLIAKFPGAADKARGSGAS